MVNQGSRAVSHHQDGYIQSVYLRCMLFYKLSAADTSEKKTHLSTANTRLPCESNIFVVSLQYWWGNQKRRLDINVTHCPSEPMGVEVDDRKKWLSGRSRMGSGSPDIIDAAD